jgi:protein gp37
MAEKTAIQWTDATWNIAVGCTKVDEDCKYCYMYRESLNSTRYEPKTIRKTKTVFSFPLKIKEPSKIFTSSLTDFFHEAIDGYRHEAWDIIRKCPQHTFQILTKRPERINDHLPEFWNEIKGRVWLGTSIGSQKSLNRANVLGYSKGNDAAFLFLSLEPLHGEINLNGFLSANKKSNRLFRPFDWVIVGGESGNDNGQYKYRPCELSWIEKIVSSCQFEKIPVFVKQLGTHLAKELKMSDRHGGNIDEFPVNLQVREFPTLKPTQNDET